MTALDRQSVSEKYGAALVDTRVARASLRQRWSAIVIAILLAFLCQSFVTQTHVHVDPVGQSARLTDPSSNLTAQKNDPSSPDLPPCPICLEIAHAGAYLLPATIAVQAPASDTVWRVFLPVTVPTRRQRSHDWQSRAPPIPLQA